MNERISAQRRPETAPNGRLECSLGRGVLGGARCGGNRSDRSNRSSSLSWGTMLVLGGQRKIYPN